MWYSYAEGVEYTDIEEVDGRFKANRTVSINMDSDRGGAFDWTEEYAQPPYKESSGCSWPEQVFSQEEALLNHPEWGQICKNVCQHGNSTLTPSQVTRIWQHYCEGKSRRVIARELYVNDMAIFRVIKRITEWMHIVGDEEAAPTEEGSTVILRGFNPEKDGAFVYSTWRNALWFAGDQDEDKRDYFYAEASQRLRRLLTAPDTKTQIACLEEDPDNIIGYSIMAGPHLNWVYVKIESRRQGIGKLLTRGFKTVATPLTHLGKKIFEAYYAKSERKTNESKREQAHEDGSNAH